MVPASVQKRQAPCVKGERDLVAAQDEDSLWSEILPAAAACQSNLEYELGGNGVRLAGLRGHGPPLHCALHGHRKPFTDGFGLCSPGRWAPALRQDHLENPKLCFHFELGRKLHKFVSEWLDPRELALKLAAGQVMDCPFSNKMLAAGRQLIWRELRLANCSLPVEERTSGQPFYLAAIEEILRLAGDPDYAAFFTGKDSFAKGVRLGVGVELPRVPAVFAAKTSWRKYEEELDSPGVRENYLSAKTHAHAQFEKEAELGAMREMTLETAEKQLGGVKLASLGAIEKKDGSFRVIHDAAHGVGANSQIKVRDQIRSTNAGDLRRALQVLPTACFALTGDVARAHRLIKVAECDWKHQGCKTGVKGSDVIWVNCVGTFGVSSAAYHWCRLMAGAEAHSCLENWDGCRLSTLTTCCGSWVKRAPLKSLLLSSSTTQRWAYPWHGRSFQVVLCAAGSASNVDYSTGC